MLTEWEILIVFVWRLVDSTPFVLQYNMILIQVNKYDTFIL